MISTMHHDGPGPLFDSSELIQALDECLDDLLLHGRSVEECLARWPALGDDLEPLLDVAAILTAWRTGDGSSDFPCSSRSIARTLRCIVFERQRAGAGKRCH